jgi:sugar O-acyltransferase (sialic acid O-acetyltransferase NeuD family)
VHFIDEFQKRQFSSGGAVQRNPMKRDIAIYGAGGFGRETLEMIRQINLLSDKWNCLGFFDDGRKIGETVDGYEILGGINEVNAWSQDLSVALTVADPLIRRKLMSGMTNPRIDFPALTHPAAILGGIDNKIGKGSIITAGVICTIGISIGEFVIVNLASTIGHDVSIGDCCTLMPACHISGAVRIEKNCLIGTGASILQNLSVGANARVGAGAVVTKNVAANTTVVGIPARVKSILKKR